MIYIYKNSLSICHGLQITYIMRLQFSIAPIIEFVETFNREVEENTSLNNASYNEYNTQYINHQLHHAHDLEKNSGFITCTNNNVC